MYFRIVSCDKNEAAKGDRVFKSALGIKLRENCTERNKRMI